MAKEPTKPRPPLEEPVPRDEIFAGEVSSVSLLHNNIIVTFGTTRVDEPLITGATPKQRRVVAARVVLTHVAAAQLITQLQGLANQIESAKAAKAKPGTG
jgi:hypothetical protein